MIKMELMILLGLLFVMAATVYSSPGKGIVVL